MPTLIRLIVVLLVLAGIGYGAMYALTVFVEPREKEVTIRIPARDLLPQTQRDPLVRREIDTTRATAPTPAAEPTSAEPLPPAATEVNEGEVVTRQQGVE